MATPRCNLASRMLTSLFIAGLIWSVNSLPATAQDVTADQILKTLLPTPTTRSLSGPQQPAISDADRTFIEGLRHRTRSLSLDESDHVAELAKDARKIDFTIYFDYNSAAITAKAKPTLNEIGKALSDSRLGNSVIVIGGHTDARGSDEYNQKLSERRAEAVKEYLTDDLKVAGDSLSTAGYGKRDLKDKAHPFASENRRVQIVNLSSLNQANR
jgi:outer membrane protein OmpA-like peptidoglycan-associated protein